MGTQPYEYVRRWNSDRAQKGWWHSFEMADGTFIDGVCGLQSLKDRIAQFPIPRDLAGKRVLDIGTWDGWFAFEMERRGADVVAVDNWDNPRFREMHAMVSSRIEYVELDMYELTPERIGRFDIVLFMGVLYHLKHPLLALERVCALTTGMSAVDSFILREEYRPGAQVDTLAIMEFYETTEFGGQSDNWIGPSLPCLLALCRTAGFARVELQSVIERSACIACYRHWEEPDAGAVAGPELLDAFHTRNFGINFNGNDDEYVGATIRTALPGLGLDDIKPEVSGYGVRPIEVRRVSADEVEFGFKLPPGLNPGMHEVRARVGNSRPGSALNIAVDLPFETSCLRIERVCDGKTWARNEIDLAKGDVLSVWLEGLPPNADRNNVPLFLDAKRLQIEHVEAGTNEPRQINARMPEHPAGPSQLSTSVDGPGLPVHIIHQ